MVVGLCRGTWREGDTGVCLEGRTKPTDSTNPSGHRATRLLDTDTIGARMTLGPAWRVERSLPTAQIHGPPSNQSCRSNQPADAAATKEKAPAPGEPRAISPMSVVDAFG